MDKNGYLPLEGILSSQQLVQKDYIRPETYNRLSEAARMILDV